MAVLYHVALKMDVIIKLSAVTEYTTVSIILMKTNVIPYSVVQTEMDSFVEIDSVYHYWDDVMVYRTVEISAMKKPAWKYVFI